MMRKSKTTPHSPTPISPIASGSTNNNKRTRTQTNPSVISSERITRRSTGFKSDFDKSAQSSIKSKSKTTPSSISISRSTRKRPVPITPSRNLDHQSTSQSKRIKLSSSNHHLRKSEDLKENHELPEDPTSDDELALKKPITRSNSKILTKSSTNHLQNSNHRNPTHQSKPHSNSIKASPHQSKGKQTSNHQRSPSPASSTNFASEKLIQLFQKHHLDLSKLHHLIEIDPQSLLSIITSGLERRSELNGTQNRINPEGELLDELNLLSQSINPNNNTDRSRRTRRSGDPKLLKPLDESSQSFLDEIKALIQLEFIEFDSNSRTNKKPSNSKSDKQVNELDDKYLLSDCLLSEVDARCLSVADESMSGGFEPDQDEEEEEDEDAVLAELAIDKPTPRTSPIRNLPIDLPQDSPNSSPTRQSSRIKKNTLPQSSNSSSIRSPLRPLPAVRDLTTLKPTPTLSQSRPISSFKPTSIPFVAVPSIGTTTSRLTSPLPTTPTRTRTRAAVATPKSTAPAEPARTAAGTAIHEVTTTTTTKSPARNSKSKKKVYSKEIVLPLLHSLLPHLSGTSPIPIQFPNTENAETIDKRTMLNEIECLVGLEETETELRMVLNRTIVEHEGNVLLLCGGRGSGKTAVVNRTLGLFEDSKMHGPNSFITIRLNGLIQTNDKLALREMSRQLIIALNSDKIESLGLEEEGNQEDLMIEDGTRFNTYAKTLKNLIHLLEPPLEQEEAEMNVSKALVIVLEEFDRFTQLDRQAFLYTLLDIVQGNKRRGGICVIGTTAVVDCLDRLEKRVKSRCQSRIQYLFSPKTFIERKELIKSLLSLKKAEVKENEVNEEIESFVNHWNDELDQCLELDCVKVWLENLFGLISDGIPKILQELNRLISTISYKLKTTGTIEFPILSKSFPFKPHPPIPTSLRSKTVKPKNWWNDSNSLSTLELSILIGAKHLSQLYDSRMFNLEMCWDSYRKHLKRSVLNEDEGGKSLENLGRFNTLGFGRSQVYGRDAFEMGWERLINLEILLPIKNQIEQKPIVENKNGLIGKRFDYVRLVLFLTEIDELIESRLDLALHMKRWCKNWSD